MAAEVRGQHTTERMPLMVIHDRVFSVLLEQVDGRFLSSTDVLTSFFLFFCFLDEICIFIVQIT